MDSCSQSTMISITVLRAAGIHRRVGDRVDVILGSMHDSQVRVTVAANVVERLDMRVPSAAVPQDHQERLKSFKLADDTFGVPGPVEMVLGAKVYPKIMLAGVLKLVGCPLAQDSKFGFLLSGPFI